MKSTTALNMAITALELQRRKHAPGKHAWLNGRDWGKTDAARYDMINEAIAVLRDMIQLTERRGDEN
jgi:hypothetical protein